MAIDLIQDGEPRASYVAKIEELIDYWHGENTSDGLETWGDTRHNLNLIAADLYEDAIEDGEAKGTEREKINAIIQSVNLTME